jgi:hypothetical protein
MSFAGDATEFHAVEEFTHHVRATLAIGGMLTGARDDALLR